MEQYLNISVLTDGAAISLPHLRKRLLLQVLGSIWTAVRVGLVLLTFSGIVLCAQQFHRNLPLPVKMKMTADKLTVPQEMIQLTQALQHLNCPQYKIASIAEGILKGSRTIGVDPKLVLALLFTESQFKLNAISPKGYKGLMQTPRASMEYADVDILYGCRILEEKMQSPAALGRNGRVDMRKAIAMYKGGLNPAAFRYADQTLALYKELNSRREPNVGNVN
jgi:soluble lytic murein transglycosylase-like protein